MLELYSYVGIRVFVAEVRQTCRLGEPHFQFLAKLSAAVANQPG